MTRAVCSGSFDPVTNGHIDIFTRAASMFDELIVCVCYNVHKQGFLPIDQRVALLETATKQLGNIKVMSFSGLLTDFMQQHDAKVIVRGVRSVKDLEYEKNEAELIRHIVPTIDTVFLLTDPQYAFVSSSAIREMHHFQADVHGLVPECVEQALHDLGK